MVKVGWTDEQHLVGAIGLLVSSNMRIMASKCINSCLIYVEMRPTIGCQPDG